MLTGELDKNLGRTAGAERPGWWPCGSIFLYGNSKLNLLRDCETIFLFLPAVNEVSNFSTSSSTLFNLSFYL